MQVELDIIGRAAAMISLRAAFLAAALLYGAASTRLKQPLAAPSSKPWQQLQGLWESQPTATIISINPPAGR